MYLEKFVRDNVFAPVLLLSVVIVAVPVYSRTLLVFTLFTVKQWNTKE